MSIAMQPTDDENRRPDHTEIDTQSQVVGPAAPAPDETTSSTRPIDAPSRRVADAVLLLYADTLTDIETTRIGMENRLRSLLSEEDWGKGVNPHLPEVAVLQALLAQLQGIEHGAELVLKRAMRAHPLGPWVKGTVGIGEKQGARLLAAIGDPAGRPNVAKLWAYCGLHVILPAGHQSDETQLRLAAGEDPSASRGQSTFEAHRTGAPTGSTSHPGDQPQSVPQDPIVAGVAPSRKKGQKANWSGAAKMRVYLVAESCIKQARSPYREVYDAGRVKYAESVHAHPCPRCGPAGHPAVVGTALSLGHQHARAMRLVMKEILKDLWVEARRLESVSDDPGVAAGTMDESGRRSPNNGGDRS